MNTPPDNAKRRRTRPRHKGNNQTPVPGPPPAPEPAPEPASYDTESERGLRGLVGAGPSQVSVERAMRARDASQPTAEDLAAAERELTIVRRHYVPPEN